MSDATATRPPDTIGDMESIGRVADRILAKLQSPEMLARRRQRRIERIAQFGWADDVNCATCGDTGRPPDGPFRYCSCAIGEDLGLAAELDELWAARVPERVRPFRVHTSPNAAGAEAVGAWVAGHPWDSGENLILVGRPGTGKTGLGVGALHAAFEGGWTVAYANAVDWLDQMRPTKDEARAAAQETNVERARRAVVLLLDDLGAEKATEWVTERVYLIVNARYDAKRPTIVTTNLTSKQIGERYGERVRDRLLERGTVVPLSGPNLRR